MYFIKLQSYTTKIIEQSKTKNMKTLLLIINTFETFLRKSRTNFHLKRPLLNINKDGV